MFSCYREYAVGESEVARVASVRQIEHDAGQSERGEIRGEVIGGSLHDDDERLHPGVDPFAAEFERQARRAFCRERHQHDEDAVFAWHRCA